MSDQSVIAELRRRIAELERRNDPDQELGEMVDHLDSVQGEGDDRFVAKMKSRGDSSRGGDGLRQVEIPTAEQARFRQHRDAALKSFQRKAGVRSPSEWGDYWNGKRNRLDRRDVADKDRIIEDVAADVSTEFGVRATPADMTEILRDVAASEAMGGGSR